MKEELVKLIQSALKNLSIETEVINLEHPGELTHGDYSSNIALVVSKQMQANSIDIAKKIFEHLKKDLPKEVEKVEIAGPGFINFFLSKEFFTQSVAEILEKKENFGKNTSLAGQKTIIEYTDANPFKEMHVGHLMNNTIGEALSRILEANGAEIKRACYQGDIGLHVAKAIWGMMKLPKTGETLPEQAAYFGKAYAHGAIAYDENAEAKAEMIAINKKVYERSDAGVNELYDWGRKVSLEYFETIYKKLGTKFDFYFFESDTGKVGKEIVEKNIGTVFEKSEGAVIFRGENHGFHTRVFLNKEGLPTYEAKELGLAGEKFKKYPYDKSIVITGNEINEYFKILIHLINEIYPELKGRTQHISHGMLRLPSGKMSSRKGEVITAPSFISAVEAMVHEKIADREITKYAKEIIAEKVAIAAIKYSILRQTPGKDIIFDFEKSISFEGDSGPYLQYACVRAKSVLEKAREEGVVPSAKIGSSHISSVEKLLYRFPEIVENALKEYAPHYIVTYLTELAGAFNSYYANNQIIGAGEETSYRLAITSAVATVLENGLNLLGMEVPEEM